MDFNEYHFHSELSTEYYSCFGRYSIRVQNTVILVGMISGYASSAYLQCLQSLSSTSVRRALHIRMSRLFVVLFAWAYILDLRGVWLLSLIVLLSPLSVRSLPSFPERWTVPLAWCIMRAHLPQRMPIFCAVWRMANASLLVTYPIYRMEYSAPHPIDIKCKLRNYPGL